MTAVVVGAMALAPGLLVWWWGRGLVRRADDPTLPERLLSHQRRLAVVAWLSLVGAAVAGGVRASLWAVPVLVLGLLLGSYPHRRRLFDEQWRLSTYLSFRLRFLLAYATVPLLVLGAPFLLVHIGWGWPERLVIGALLLGGIAASGWLMTLFLPLRPLQGEPQRRLAPLLAAVDERARVPAPLFLCLDNQGGRWSNALALPGVSRRAVIFSEALLALLTPEETAAIYAHEVAHLEHFTPRRVVRLRLFLGVVALSGVLGLPLVPGSWQDLALVGWSLSVLALLLLRIRWLRGHEGESDLRAAELCGDPEALIRGLTKIYHHARLPRRLALATEAGATHPSLAHRLQSLRRLTGSEVSTPLPELAVADAGAAGSFLLLDGERATWLDGVPEGTDLHPTTLREAAGAVTSVRHGELVELRLVPGRGHRARVVAADKAGRRWETAITSQDAARVQTALDAVDHQQAAGGVGRRPSSPTLLRLVAGVTLVLAPLSPASTSQALGSLLTLIRPAPLPLMACGAAGVGGVVAAVVGGGEVGALTGALGVPAALLGFFLLFQGVVLARRQPESRRCLAQLSLLLLAAATLTGWLVALGLGEATGWSPPYLRQVARVHSLAVFPLQLAAALVVWGPTLARRLAPFVALAAAFPSLLGSNVVLGRVVTDPLLPRAVEAATVRELPLSVLDEQPLPSAVSLELSPDGRRFAAQARSPDGEPGRAAGSDRQGPRWLIGSFGDGEKTTRTLTATRLAFLDEEHILRYREDWQGGELSLVDAFGKEEPSWSLQLPRLGEPELTVVPTTKGWRLVGSPQDTTEAVRLSGKVGGDDYRETRWVTPPSARDGYTEWKVGAAGAALALVHRFHQLDRFPDWWLSLPLPFPQARTELWLVGEDRPLRVVETALQVGCGPGGRNDEWLCWSWDGERSHLFRLDPEAASLALIASLVTDGLLRNAEPAGEQVVLWSWYEAPYLLDGAGTPARLDLGGEEPALVAVAPGSRLLAALVYRQGVPWLRRFRLPG